MVFSPLHWIPSSVAAVLAIAIGLHHPKKYTGLASIVMACFAFIGLLGYATGNAIDLLLLDFHSLHGWIGIFTLVLSLFVPLSNPKRGKMAQTRHCAIGRAASMLAIVSLVMGSAMLTGSIQRPSLLETSQYPASNILPEVESENFLGIPLTPLSSQRNNAIMGTQFIDQKDYHLTVRGLVSRQLNMTLSELRDLPVYTEIAYMPCVEGWGFTAKWTGFRVVDLLELAAVKPGASYVMFHSSDGYSTGLPLKYLLDKKILMAYGINDLTLPPERGFPFQLVAEQKYGYKWAKWITSIEVLSQEEEGYWESRGYSNSADVGGYPFK